MRWPRITISDFKQFDTEYYAYRPGPRHPTQRPRGTGCGCGTSFDKPVILWSGQAVRACHGEDLVQMLQSQSGLGSTVVHVHTYNGKAQIAVKKLVSLLRTGSVQFLVYPCLNRTSISFVSQTVALLRGPQRLCECMHTYKYHFQKESFVPATVDVQ